MHSITASLNRLRPLVPVILRVLLGVIFLWHGIDKFRGAGITGVEGAFDMRGVPAPGLTAPLTAGVEVVGGAALILGLMTRLTAAVLSVIMIGALLFVTLELGLISGEPKTGAELDLALLAGLVALVFLGPGPLSVDDQVGLDPAEALQPVT